MTGHTPIETLKKLFDIPMNYCLRSNFLLTMDAQFRYVLEDVNSFNLGLQERQHIFYNESEGIVFSGW